MSDYHYLEKFATCASCRTFMGWQDNAYPICTNCKSEAKAESWRAEDFIFDETKLANFPNGDRDV
jgi:RNA polymerase subunit RPABC4/transcription elongation factor Spt4